MKSYSLTHVPDHALLRGTRALVSQEGVTLADLLAHLAETDTRRLYAPAGYDSMIAWCVGELRLSEDAAFRRIRAARTARQFPSIFPALADGRLNLSSVLLVRRHLTQDRAEELLTAIAGKTRPEVERLLAERYPRPDLPATVRELAPAAGQAQLAPAPVEASAGQLAPAPVEARDGQLGPAPVELRPGVDPLSAGRFGIQFTFSDEQNEKLRYFQSLLGHAVPSGDLARVFERALDTAIRHSEREKFAAAARTRPGRGSKSPRYVPSAVRRTVWQRDQGQCTFVGTNGHRCESRTRLEFDHVEPVARGGTATVSGVRLRCRTHNQLEAERAFGSDFMRTKRERRRVLPSRARASVSQRETLPATDHDVVPWLRALGFRLDESRRAAAACDRLEDATLEQRVRVAIASLAPPGARRTTHFASSSA
jgi:5-methylcytosine-specific restriction endonuclease McrA